MRGVELKGIPSLGLFGGRLVETGGDWRRLSGARGKGKVQAVSCAAFPDPGQSH